MLPPSRPAGIFRSSVPPPLAIIHSLNVSAGGVPKWPVAEAIVEAGGLVGDRQRNLKYHGGPERAVCVYALERIAALRAEGHPIGVGSTGENVTLAGLAWELVVPGVRLALGDVLVEVSSFTRPCWTITGSFAGRRIGRVSQSSNPGWSRVYARVLVPGRVRVGEAASIVV
jgi:MOSC domain-containing protein YiiM